MMRVFLTILGVLAIGTYSVLGALLMNDWAVAAASEMPLNAAIDEMNAANQAYGVAAGFVFVAIGTLLALAWGVLVMLRRFRITVRAALSTWAGVIAFGAPAYFYASFGNMNSVGDTFYGWNAEAALALEAPLYLVSGVATLVAVVAVVTVIVTVMVQSMKSKANDHQ